MEKTYYYNLDYVVRETPMPSEKEHGFCLIDEDGRANIYLNSLIPEMEKLRALRHELIHYDDSDHYRDQERAESEVRDKEQHTILEIGFDGYLKLRDAI